MKQLLIASLLCAVATPTFAVIVGDRDWRQLTDSVSYTYEEFASVCDVTSGACSGSLNNGLNPISVDGWTWASETDVRSLFQSFNAVQGGLTRLADGSAAALRFMEAFNFTYAISDPRGDFVAGITRTDYVDDPLLFVQGGPWMGLFSTFGSTNGSEFSGFAAIGLGRDSFTGAWMYRAPPSAVPEPASLLMLSLGLVGLGFARKCEHKV